MSKRLPRASGYFRTSYAPDLALVETKLERVGLLALLVILAGFPFLASAFWIDLASQIFRWRFQQRAAASRERPSAVRRTVYLPGAASGPVCEPPQRIIPGKLTGGA